MRWLALAVFLICGVAYAGRPRIPQPKTPDEVHQNDQDLIDKIEDLKRRTASDPEDLVISSGEIRIKRHFHRVDTEGGAATDDLDTISGGSVGDTIVLQTLVDSRDVTVKDSATLNLAGDFTLGDTKDKIMLIKISTTTWDEISRSDN